MLLPSTGVPALIHVLCCGALLSVGAAVATDTPPVRASDLDLTVDVTRLEPDVRIQSHENRVVEEYAVNGNVYMLKVTPAHGRPYYLTDPDGDGELEWRRNAAGLDVQPPQWALFKW